LPQAALGARWRRGMPGRRRAARKPERRLPAPVQPLDRAL